MNFGKRTPEPEARRIIERAIASGIRVFDTANAYNDGASEKILGAAVKDIRKNVRIATKVGFGRIGGKPEGLSRARMLAAIDESLSRLGTDYVDIYYLHVPDATVPLEESVRTMGELLAQGKIRSWGVSNYASWQILEMMLIADRLGIERPVIAQQLYNMMIRQLEIEYFAFARAYRLETTVFNALAGGLLSGKHEGIDASQKGSRFDRNPLYQRRYWTELMFQRVQALTEVARAERMSLSMLSYAWLAGRPGVDSVLVGPATVEHLDDALLGLERRISPEAAQRIDEISRHFQGTDTNYTR